MFAALIPMIASFASSMMQKKKAEEEQQNQEGSGATGGMFNMFNTSGRGGASGSGRDFLPMAASLGASSIFGPKEWRNPAEPAHEWMGHIPGQLEKYLPSYINAGNRQLPGMESQIAEQQARYGQLMKDPNALMDMIGRGYKASPGYQYNVDQATRASNQAAAAGGMMGTPSQQAALAGEISGLASKDYNEYVGRGMDTYKMGMMGDQQAYGNKAGIYDTGYKASSSMAQAMSQYYQNQAELAYRGQAADNMRDKRGFTEKFADPMGFWK